MQWHREAGLLIYIAGTGSVEVGSSLGLVHGVGRAIPLILISALAIIGVNTTKGLVANRIKIEKMTGWMLVFLGSFLIINGMPGGHQWYEETFVHIMWNNIVSMAPIPPEFHVGQHTHDPLPTEMPKSMVPVILISLLAAPIMWKIYINRKKSCNMKDPVCGMEVGKKGEPVIHNNCPLWGQKPRQADLR